MGLIVSKTKNAEFDFEKTWSEMFLLGQILAIAQVLINYCKGHSSTFFNWFYTVEMNQVGRSWIGKKQKI